MTDKENVWDVLSGDFNADKSNEIDPYTADNIVIAWPPMKEFIKTQPCHRVETRSAIDFGCGAGWFSRELKDMGYKVDGVDTSSGMIQAAMENVQSVVDFAAGGSETVLKRSVERGKYNLALGMMVFQFIENHGTAFSHIGESLSDDSSLVFAVVNPEWVKLCVEQGERFQGFTSPNCLGRGVALFQEGREQCPVFVRTAEQYDQVLKPLGFQRQLKAHPEFTEEFVEKYGSPGPTEKSEYMILGYSRS